MRRIAFLILCCLALASAARRWQPDVLGHGFEMTYIDQGTDYSGPVRCTLVRLSAPQPSDAGVLYIHGFNDYFFQEEMARQFVDHGYEFYAVDLRKYGRSLMDGQTPFQVHDMAEYYADIDSALAVMRQDGVRRVVLMGHSTGGLTASLYMATHRHTDVQALVLNSPFLDWNQSAVQEKLLIPVVRTLSPLARGIKIPQDGDTGYSHSLLRQYGGEWDYNTDWKMEVSPAVEASWIAAIDAAQDVVQRDPNIAVPILLMHSDSTVAHGDGPAEYARKDAVLDVEDISRYGRRLGIMVTEITVNGGLHDLALSAPAVRTAMYTYLFTWLSTTCPATAHPRRA